MARNGSVSVNLKGLEDLGKGWNKGYYVKVGVLGAKNARNDGQPVGNADLGVIHEFGTTDGKIPARSWLRFPLEYKAKDILKWLSTGKVKLMIVEGKSKQVMNMLGGIAEGIIQDAFTSRGFGQWKPNAPSTIAAKGSSAPLIDTSQLRRAVTHEVKNSQDKS